MTKYIKGLIKGTGNRTDDCSVTSLGDLLDFGHVLQPLGKFYSLWQQLICPNLPHTQAIFVKVSKSFIFLVKSFLGNFYRHFFWSHWLLLSQIDWVSFYFPSFDMLHLLQPINFIEDVVGCRHSSVDSSVLSILQLPSTPTTLLSFIIKFVLYLSLQCQKRTKIYIKEAGFGPLKNVVENFVVSGD